jgi:pimeloyl-ACP methyl ester carboxylesterase
MMQLQNLEERWVISGGQPVHYWQSNRDTYSASTTLVHIHGFGISGRYLLPTADLLAGDYRTIVPNLPGYGRSVHPEKVLSIPQLATSLIELLDTLSIEQATLVGNSMGCIISIEVARLVPERIERLILISPAGGRNNRPIFKGVAQLALDGLRESPRMFTIAVPDYLRFGLINAGRLFWQMIHYPTVERFSHTGTKTLAVLGERDPLVNEQRIVAGTEHNDHIQIVRISGAAHAINYSHPEQLAQLSRQYIEGRELEDDWFSPNAVSVLRRHKTPSDQSGQHAAVASPTP